MDIASRLKTIRETLGLSQREMAKKLEISLGGLQSYESGKSVPGGNALEALARLGFNVNWLLTGEGEMESAGAWINRSVYGIGERIRIIRGDESLRVFAARFSIDENKITAYEAELLQPDLNFLADICKEYNINPGWMLVGLSPKQIDNIAYADEEVEVVSALDEKILREVLQSIQDSYNHFIEEGLEDESIFYDLVGMTTLIKYCYEEDINEEVNKTFATKKAKVKRLVGLITNAKHKA